MGWTCFASHGRDTISLLQKETVCENEHGRWEWLDHSQRGSVVYALLKLTPKGEVTPNCYVRDADGSYRFIIVFLTSRKGRDGYDFGYKDVTETMGPVEKDCPRRLINKASPFTDGYEGHGRAWRKACLDGQRVKRQAAKTKPKPGDRFRTDRPVSFRDGTSHSEFTCVRVKRRGRTCTAYAVNGSPLLYRFRPEAIGFEIVSAQTNGDLDS